MNKIALVRMASFYLRVGSTSSVAVALAGRTVTAAIGHDANLRGCRDNGRGKRRVENGNEIGQPFIRAGDVGLCLVSDAAHVTDSLKTMRKRDERVQGFEILEIHRPYI